MTVSCCGAASRHILTVIVSVSDFTRAVPDLFFPIRPEQDFAGFEMTYPAGAGTGAGAGFSS